VVRQLDTGKKLLADEEAGGAALKSGARQCPE
jgi:hypothetical protein